MKIVKWYIKDLRRKKIALVKEMDTKWKNDILTNWESKREILLEAGWCWKVLVGNSERD